MPDLPDILRTTQPESPERTKLLGDIVSEALRALNHSTLGDAPGLEDPGDVYDLLGALSTAANRLPQLLGQLGAYLQNQSTAGRLRVEQGSSIEAVADAGGWLMRAKDAASALKYALEQAHQITATMGGTDG